MAVHDVGSSNMAVMAGQSQQTGCTYELVHTRQLTAPGDCHMTPQPPHCYTIDVFESKIDNDVGFPKW